MSSRNRNARPNRSSGSTQGEEAQLWAQVKDDIKTMVDGINTSNDGIRDIVAQDNYIAKNKDGSGFKSSEEEQKLDSMFRSGVKYTDTSKAQIDALIEHVTVLRALVKAREDAEAQAAGATALSSRERPGLLSNAPRSNSMRGASSRDKEQEKKREQEQRQREQQKQYEQDRDPGSVYEFDGAGDSPVPSPIGGHTRKLGGSAGAGSDRSGNRDSLPPRGGTPSKAESVPPESVMPGSATAAQRAKVQFFKGQDVVFKPKPTATNESPDWMMGRVQQVTGDGKARRYKVQDADPDLTPDQRAEYRTNASAMIPIPTSNADLPDLEKGKTVLALYPDSTTFYKAEVIGKDAPTGRVSLRFEGEENSVTLQLVERRYVVEYRS
ncbi:SGF29 tudor-like domain-containing protein [Cercophora newfieldiana]|uniref:SGF29 tudor-like domain-containing protein n=1 Tax=Cercophora newfieldiana TaxID=92897 RepID=A0AA39YK91_9PEZI|nr:SGF29 tudor-like domain-containing protein [Cercophora newfieldiana]